MGKNQSSAFSPSDLIVWYSDQSNTITVSNLMERKECLAFKGPQLPTNCTYFIFQVMYAEIIQSDIRNVKNVKEIPNTRLLLSLHSDFSYPAFANNFLNNCYSMHCQVENLSAFDFEPNGESVGLIDVAGMCSIMDITKAVITSL